MVTHDLWQQAQSGDYVKRRQVFTEIYQGEDDKNVFHKEITCAYIRWHDV